MINALGTEIVFGQKYGYSISQNSIVSVVVGRATKETGGGKCTLSVESRSRFIYGRQVDPTFCADVLDSKNFVVHVQPCHLFPVAE